VQIPQALKDRLAAPPRWQLWVAAALIIFAAVYLAWCKWGAKPVRPGQTVAAVAPSSVKDEPKKAITPKQVIVYRDRVKVVEKLGLPAAEGANDEEEVIEATEAPASRYGTQTATFVNVSTGQVRSVVKANSAPWFRFERGNTAGAEIGIGPKGRYFQGDYQRDILSVKGVILAGRVSVTSYPGQTDARAGVRAEYRW
jgi:hypothetical protein